MQHCGICSVLAELFRRIMCINRRGSGDTYNPDSGDDDSGRGVVTIKHTEDHGIVIHVVDPVAPTTRNRKLSDSDWLLLETLDKRCQRPLYTRRFLTMHKRRRKKLTTRLLTLEPALLDDIQHGQVQCVLDRVWQWPFNAFTLDTVTGGRSLPVLCVHLFHWYGLLDHFNLDVVRVWKLFTLVEEGYHSTNPYHNSIHATDVTQAMHCFLQEDKIQKHLTPLEIMSSLIAAVTHDLDHPGVNQPFLIATSNHLAALYENTSVLENHHWRSAIGCLLESRVAEQLGPSKCELEHQISSLILATDITRQQEFLTRFKRYLDQSLLDMHRVNDRHFILQIALKCADISNPCRPWDVSRKWSQKVCEEFFRQGDYERQLNLPVTSLCDRQTTSVPKIQAGFFRFVVSPLFEEWHRFLGTKLSHLMMKHLRGNQGKWEAMVEKELAEETHTEVSDADVLDEEVECNSEEEAQDFVTGSVEMLIPNLPSHQATAASTDDKYIRKIGRRHSVPLSVPRPPPFAQTIIRRESLPVGDSKSKRSSPTSNLTLETRPERKEHGSSLSLVSSCSGSGLQHSSGRRSKQENRPVSTENLLPEPSIASITTSVEASRLSSVLHGASSSVSRSVLAPSTLGPARFLTRQQTFPPLQQYVRIRYMSTTAEMANCSEPLTGIGSYSNSSTSSHVDFVSNVPSRRASEAMADSQSSPESTGGCKNGCGTPTGRPRALQHNNRTSVEQLFQCTSGCSVGSDRDTSLRFMCKKEQTDQTELLRDKGSNGSKTCDTTLLQQITSGKVMTSDDYGKENVDPRNSGSDVDQDINISGSKNSILRRNSHQGLVQRRGSAPVGLLSRSDDNSGPTTFPLRGEGDRFLRRGSVPIDITRQSVLTPLGIKENSVCLHAHCMPRRSSLPYDLVRHTLSSLLDPLTVPAGHRDGGDNRSNDSGVGRQNLLAINLRMPECCLPSASTHHRYVQARRGSAPVESSLEFCRLDANSNSRNVNNGHVRNNKKVLCRHNSGGS